MTDLASLSFDIDSSQAQRAVSVLETLRASSISVTQANTQQNASATQLSQTYASQLDDIRKLSDITRNYDGTLRGLIGQLNALRPAMRDSQIAADAFGRSLVTATANAATFNSTVTGLERYVTVANTLKVSVADLATGFERVTAALNLQTQAGVNARTALAQLGVSTAGLNPQQGDQVLQRLADQLRTYRLTSNTIGLAQQVLGPNFDAQALIALQNQPYRTSQQRIDTERQTAARTQIDTQQSEVIRRRADLQRQRDELADLDSQFTTNPSFLGRELGGLADRYGLSQADTLKELRRIQGLSEVEQQRYRRDNLTNLRRRVDQSPGMGFIRNFTSGTFGSNETEIGQRFDEDAFNSRWGALGALPAAWGRQIQNAVGPLFGAGYKPLYDHDARELSPGDQRLLRRQSGEILSNLGDPSLANLASAEDRQVAIDDPAVRKRYGALFGDDGTRRFSNLSQRAALDLRYAQTPEARLSDDTARQQLLLSLPEEQRAEARARLDATAQLEGPAAANLPIGTTLAGIRDNAALNTSERNAVTGQFNQGVAGRLQLNSEDINTQIGFQKELAETLNTGRAAAEDFSRSWSAYRRALLDGAGEEASVKQGVEAGTLALAQRVTQARAMTVEQEHQNAVSEKRIAMARSLAGADPIVRRTAELSLGLRTDTEKMIADGQLPSPQGGEFHGVHYDAPGAQAEIDRSEAARRTALAQGGVSGGQGLRDAQQTQLTQATHLAEIMERQGLTQEQATRQIQIESEFQDKIAAAALETDKARLREVESLRAATQELDRQNQLQGARAANLSAGQTAEQQTTLNTVLSQLSPDQLAVARQLAPNFFATVNAGQVSVTDADRGRAVRLRARLEQDGLTPEGSAAMVAHGIAETHLQPVNEVNPTVPGSAGGLGIWQQTGPRRKALEAFARAHSLDPMSEEASIQFTEEEMKTRYPRVWQTLRTPGVSAGANSLAMSDFEFEGDAGLHARHDVPRAALAETLAHGGGPITNANPKIEAAFRAIINHETPDLSGLPANVVDSLTDLRSKIENQVRSGAVVNVQEEARRTREQLDLIARQNATPGSPGLAARQQVIDTTKPRDLAEVEAGYREAVVRASQNQQFRTSEANTGISVDNLNREAEAARQGAGALDTLTTQLKAEAQARELGLTGQQTRIRQLHLEAEALAQVGAAAERGTLSARDQTIGQRSLTAAAGGGPVALANAQIAERQGAEERLLLEQRAGETDKARIALIDEKIAALHRETKAQQDLALAQRETAAVSEAHRLDANSNIQRDINSTNIFATPRDMERARDQAVLNQRFRDDPDLAASPAGDRLREANATKQALADETEKINEMREAAHDATGAIEHAMSTLASGAGHGRQAVLELLNAFEQIAMKQLVFKPFEKMLSQMFGGGESEGSGGGGGGGGGNGGGGSPGAIGVNALAKMIGNSGGGGSAGTAAALGSGDTAAGGAQAMVHEVMAKAARGGADETPSSAAVSTEGGSLVRQIFGHANGFGGYIADSVMGKGFSESGGFLGVHGLNLPPWLGGSSQAMRDQYANDQGLTESGDTTFGGTGGTGGAAGTGYVTPPPLPPSMEGVTSTGGDFGGFGGGGFGGGGDLGGADAFTVDSYAFGGLFSGNDNPEHISTFENQVVSSPTLFRFARGGQMGQMGEAGPEAIMPLKTGPDGRLGVSMHGASGGGASVVFNISTPNADSFRNSQSQISARALNAATRTNQRNGH